jgi:D-alanine--poly(phosphoribitol) ligase subunit 1
VIDTAGKILPDAEIGELWLGSSQVAQGYWRLPDTTAGRCAPPRDASIIVRWYRTGDLVHNTLGDGLLFHGRSDRQVNIRGYCIELQDIEASSEPAASWWWPITADGFR